MTARLAMRRIGGVTQRWRGPLALAIVVSVTGDVLLRLSGDPATAYASLLDVVLILTPLMTLVLGTTRMHHAREMIELMLAQPVSRRRVFADLWLRGTVPLAVALGAGVIAPFAWQGSLSRDGAVMPLVLAGAAAMLVLMSHSLAMIIALRIDDRVRALGVALMAWLVAAVLWDGLVLVVALLFADRPIEIPVLAMLVLNPVDLVRVLLLLGSDAAALLGYTGAVVSRSLGTAAGRAAIGGLVVLWLVLPLWWAKRTFERKDF
jgi:Cu-processing system permease protein